MKEREHVQSEQSTIFIGGLVDSTIGVDTLLDSERRQDRNDGHPDASVSHVLTRAFTTTKAEDNVLWWHHIRVDLHLAIGTSHNMTIRVEGVSIGVEFFIVEHSKEVGNDDAAFRNVVVAVNILLVGKVGDT